MAHPPGIPPRDAFRIRLRPPCPADEALYCGLYTDPATMAYVASPLTAAQARASFRSILHDADTDARPHIRIVVEKATGKAIGLAGWQPPNLRRRWVELGAMLHADARNQGYSVEAVTLIVDRAFAALPIDAVWVQYQPAHVAAGRLCDRLGMHRLADDAMGGAVHGFIVRTVSRASWPCC
ncbi:MAG: GNAT family N-acetyltransferase [Proteobacteria bacterium]|nr:GNAT family N-acetyltransferase [Pseudomonadota bacterium]